MNQQDVILGRAVLAWGLVQQPLLEDCAQEVRRWGEMGRPTTLGEVLLARGLLSLDRYQTILAHLRQTYMAPGIPRSVQQATARVPAINPDGRYTRTYPQPGSNPAPAHDSNLERAVRDWRQASNEVTASGSQILPRSQQQQQQPPQRLSEEERRRPDAFLRKKLQVPPGVEQFPIGPWMVQQYLATGNWGLVYRVVHTQGDGRPYALKLLKQQEGSEEVRQRFIQEARTMAKLRHRGICHVHDAGVMQGFLYFVMDFLDGPVLKDQFEDGPLSVPDAVRVVEELCEAVGYAHSQGILHRDLKPENVIMVERRRPVLTDFGLAKDTESEMQLTQAGQRIGTPLYMAPEMLLDASQATVQTEVYSLGAMLYQCLTGKVPFFAKSMMDLVDLIEEGKIEPVRKAAPDAPKALEKLCLRALSKDPDERPGSVAELLMGLKAAR